MTTATGEEWVGFEVTLRQHTALGTGARSDFRNDTFRHIPGSVVRGACAAAWIRDHHPVDDPDERARRIAADTRFLDIFEGDGVFGPAFPSAGLPMPLSVWTHKGVAAPGCAKLWWDRALGEVDKHCPECGRRLVQSKGVPIGEVPVFERMRVSLGLDGTAKDGSLFERSSLRRGTVLTGWLGGSAVRAFEREDGPITRLSLGGERSVQGAADIRLVGADPAPEPLERHGDHLVLRLSTPGVFVDDFGLPSDRPAAAELTRVLGVGTAVESAWTKWTTVGGWHAASGLPKPVERAVAAGSTYLVRCGEAPDDTVLRALRVHGLGLRRREGFGALYATPRYRLEDECAPS